MKFFGFFKHKEVFTIYKDLFIKYAGVSQQHRMVAILLSFN